MTPPAASTHAAPLDRASAPPWLAGPAADALALAWGFAEATLFFIVPDVIITLAAGFSPRRGLRALALATAGAVVGGLLMYAWSSAAPQQARDAVANVPFVRVPMFARVADHYAAAGPWAPCLGPTSAIPYKLYAIAAPAHAAPASFALISIPARIERFIITWAQFALIGMAARRFTSRPRRWILAVHAAYWLVLYAYLWFVL